MPCKLVVLQNKKYLKCFKPNQRVLFMSRFNGKFLNLDKIRYIVRCYILFFHMVNISVDHLSEITAGTAELL